MNLDAFWLLFIQDHLRNGLLTPLMVVVTMLGNKGIIWMVLIALLLWRRRTRWVGALAAVSFLVNAGLAELFIKHAVMRPRPFLSIPELQTLVAQPLTYSFPSVHTVSSFSVAFIVWRSSLRKWRWPVSWPSRASTSVCTIRPTSLQGCCWPGSAVPSSGASAGAPCALPAAVAASNGLRALGAAALRL